MEHAPHPGKFPDYVHGVGVGVPVVDDHRQLKLLGQGQLLPQHLLLQVPGWILRPVVVQADLTDGHHLILLGQSPDLRQVLRAEIAAVFRMDAHGSVDMGKTMG